MIKFYNNLDNHLANAQAFQVWVHQKAVLSFISIKCIEFLSVVQKYTIYTS